MRFWQRSSLGCISSCSERGIMDSPFKTGDLIKFKTHNDVGQAGGLGIVVGVDSARWDVPENGWLLVEWFNHPHAEAIQNMTSYHESELVMIAPALDDKASEVKKKKA